MPTETPGPDLFFAYCPAGDQDGLRVGQGPGWYLLYPGEGEDEDVLVGPHETFGAAVAAAGEDRP